MKFYNPDNFKQGSLILGRFKARELVYLLVSMIVSVILIIVIGQALIGLVNPMILMFFVILALLPVGLAFFFKTPKTGYHNALYYFKIKMRFKKTQRKYMWEGIQYDDEDE